jgi:elongator complex protein 3
LSSEMIAKRPAQKKDSAHGWDASILQGDVWMRTYIIWWPVDMISDRAFVSLDTRSREIRHRRPHEREDIITVIREYQSSVGTEFFISNETSQGYLYGFTRLLLPTDGETIDYPWLWKGTALIRELHVYGNVSKIKNATGSLEMSEGGYLDISETSPMRWTIQHTGVGRTVMSIAEQIAKRLSYQRLSVIAGIGVKEYYRNQLWYHDDGTYVVKGL